MAATSTANKARPLANRELLDFDPDSADLTDVKWVDMRDYDYFLVGVFRSVGTGDIDNFHITANTESDGSGTDRIIDSHALGSAVDAVGDYIWLEVTAEQVAEVATDNSEALRYVSAQVELATSTDECVVYYERGAPKFAQDDLTADNIQ